MKAKTLFATALAVVLVAPLVGAYGQHGEAPKGDYPRNYLGRDTWTGQLSAIDPEKREITLTATTKNGPESFVAYLPDHFAIDRDGKRYEVQMSDFAIGQSIRIYYIPKNPKVDGQKVKRNEIIKIDSGSPAKGS